MTDKIEQKLTISWFNIPVQKKIINTRKMDKQCVCHPNQTLTNSDNKNDSKNEKKMVHEIKL